MPELNTPEEIRDFLRLCLNPPGRAPRTPANLAQVMPDWLYGPLHEHAPHLAALRAETERLDEAAARAHRAHAAALARWIEGTETPSAPAGVVEEQTPVQLRWGLDDIQYGDDGTTIVMLSDEERRPYWLELEPDRAAALRADLAGPDSDEQLVPYHGEHGYPEGEEPTTALHD
ncbi:hypothetical protein ABZ619_39060 [Streptomyces sp. NPDC007851]|uniref:hypothetical protein n=1 Tax=Streptomyces sp. NPDC007851 TaxID=3155008 RepID=UPI0033F6F0E7